MPSKGGQIRIGISGWDYPDWRGSFYPPGLARKRELEYASRRFASIEINGSFYSLQSPESYRRWREETPEGFVFAVKGSRFITHMKKLRDVEAPLANFLASGILRLREKLGPILWQFPPNLGFDRDRFETFLRLLPRDTRAAARLAHRHDSRLEGRAYTRAEVDLPLRHAFEMRHASFRAPEWIELLRRYGAANVVADASGKWPCFEDLSGDFAYARLHGSSELYASGYGRARLKGWAERVRSWARSRDVYVYFDNDALARAPFDALTLASLLGARLDRGALLA